MNKDKISIIIFCVCMMTSPSMFSQTIDLSKKMIEHNKGYRDAIVAEIEPSSKKVKGTWKSYLNDNYDVKLKGFGLFTNKDVLYAEGIKLNELSKKRINLYTKFKNAGGTTKMIVFASLGYDIYFSQQEYPEEFNKMRMIVSAFLKDYLPEYYQKELDKTEEKKEELEEVVIETKDGISDKQDEIESLKEEIISLEGELEENTQKVEELNNLLEQKHKDLETINNKLKTIK